MLSITLNSFVHRVADKSAVLSLVTQLGCQLKRIRRSRHWQLRGDEEQLRELCQRLDTENDQWIVAAIEKSLPAPAICFETLLAETPSMSVSQLVTQTGCSLIEARQALDKLEGFE
tara:strand:- start:10726 stop:11073 length:348 start_codon:yes stop_codon:yes gene_type:complete